MRFVARFRPERCAGAHRFGEAKFARRERLGRRCSRCSGSAGLRQQARFATTGGVLVDDAALGCLINGRNQLANARHVGCSSAARHCFVHLAQTCEHAAVAERTARRLTGAFGGGFRVGHESGTLSFLVGVQGGGGAPLCQPTAPPVRLDRHYALPGRRADAAEAFVLPAAAGSRDFTNGSGRPFSTGAGGAWSR